MINSNNNSSAHFSETEKLILKINELEKEISFLRFDLRWAQMQIQKYRKIAEIHKKIYSGINRFFA